MSRFALLVLAFAACGGSGTGSTGGGTGVGGGAPGDSGGTELTISADKLSWPYRIGGSTPSAFHDYLDVSVSLIAAGTGAQPIAFPLFSVETQTGLRIQASPNTPLLPRGCAANQSLAPGGSTACELVFEVPYAEVPVAIVWLDAMGSHQASAPLPSDQTPAIVASCRQSFTLKNFDTSACGDCIKTKCSGQNGCSAAETSSSGCNTPGGYCACLGQAQLSMACQQTLTDGFTCETTTCASPCR